MHWCTRITTIITITAYNDDVNNIILTIPSLAGDDFVRVSPVSPPPTTRRPPPRRTRFPVGHRLTIFRRAKPSQLLFKRLRLFCVCVCLCVFKCACVYVTCTRYYYHVAGDVRRAQARANVFLSAGFVSGK